MIHFCMVHNEILIRQLTILTCTDKADKEMTETDLLKKKEKITDLYNNSKLQILYINMCIVPYKLLSWSKEKVNLRTY